MPKYAIEITGGHTGAKFCLYKRYETKLEAAKVAKRVKDNSTTSRNLIEVVEVTA